MAKSVPPIVLILGQDSLRSDRALASVLKARKADPAEVVGIWGDESSFAEVFAAASSRSLFSDQTVVVVRRAEKLRGGGSESSDDVATESDPEAPPERAESRGGPKVASRKSGLGEVPELDAWSTLILVVSKADRRIGIWKRISKVAEVIDADYLKGRSLAMAAMAEAKTLGLRVDEDVLKETIDQSGPSLARIVSEFEKMRLYQGDEGLGSEEVLAVTSSQPLYHLADALMLKRRREALSLLDQALRQGEAGLKVLATVHGTIRKLAFHRALRRTGVSVAEAAEQAGILPFKVAETEQAARSWSDDDIGTALAVFAEADRRLKLSAPASPLLTHAIAAVTSGGRH